MTINNVQSKQKWVALNVPNCLTYGRILAVPGMAACFFFLEGNKANWIAVGLFIAAAVTDFFDGYLARIWEQQSSLGRMLDPIADKLLVGVALLMLVGEDIIGDWSLWAAIIILSREILVSGLREYLGQLSVSVPVTQLAKYKTTMQMAAIGILLIGPAGDDIWVYTSTVGLTLLWAAALVTLYTGYDYFRAGLRHVLERDY
ncbi:MAG: CDP-diacylglycerol--glycerol-3-phosphate 3-phosphatidyltransferase [Pseudomonadota bacterium]